jgi:hypothetical protein
MRRLLGSVVSTVLITAIIGLAPPAQAGGTPERFTYHSTGLSTSWNERQSISADAYERVRWYVNAYLRQEGSRQRFSAYVSRYEYLCERREGSNRFRCHLVSRFFGVERDLADVTFNVDPKFDDAMFVGDLRLRQVKNHEVVAVKNVHVSASLVGRGDVYRQKESYTTWDGNCPEARYRFEYRYRRADASVSITGDLTASPEKVRASMSDADGFVLRRKCD